MGGSTMKLASVRCEDITVFAPVIGSLDSLYWFIETQGGYLPDPNEEAEGQWLDIDCDGDLVFALDLGCFSKVLQRLVLDEWTCLTGVRCSREELPSVAKAYLNLKDSFLMNTHVDLIAKWNGILAVHPDGWWEIVSGDQGLLVAVCGSHVNRISDLTNLRIGENP